MPKDEGLEHLDAQLSSNKVVSLIVRDDGVLDIDPDESLSYYEIMGILEVAVDLWKTYPYTFEYGDEDDEEDEEE